MRTDPSTGTLPESTKDLDFDAVVYSYAPEGWQRPKDLTAVFLVAASLEYRERQKYDLRNPLADHVYPQLPTWCKYDPFHSLLRHGGLSDSETSRQALSYADTLELTSGQTRGELFGRFPLLQLTWMYLDEVSPRVIGKDRDYLTSIQRLQGTLLGQLGTALFLASLKRKIFGIDELSPVEMSFAAGHPFKNRGLNGVESEFRPGASVYIQSIWPICFRLIESRSPEFFLEVHSERVDEVSGLLKEAGRLGPIQDKLPNPYSHLNYWPGWR